MKTQSFAAVLEEEAPRTWSNEVPRATPEALIEAGFHFGHRTAHWNPKMKSFIRDKSNGIHIIDLKESLRGLIRAKHFLRNLASTGADVCFVGTKKQAQDIVREEALRAGQAFVSTRWLGGAMTNFPTIRRRVARLDRLEDLEAKGEFSRMPKKMQSVLSREKAKIHSNLEGLRKLEKIPAALVVVDASHEKIAIKEANKLGVPVVAIVDTDSDPDLVDIIIPGNDDSIRGLQIVLRELASACVEGKQLYDSGQGMALKMEIGLPDAPPPKQRDNRRDRRTGHTRRDRRTSHTRTDAQKGEIEASADEAVKQAESQSDKAPAPAVRTKPPRAKKEPAASESGE